MKNKEGKNKSMLAVVKYDNELNKINLGEFTALEQNLLMSILFYIRNRGYEEINISADFLKKKAFHHRVKQDNFEEIIQSMFEKFFKINFRTFRREGGQVTVGYINLFEKLEFTYLEDYSPGQKLASKSSPKSPKGPITGIKLQVTNSFLYMLNELKKNFINFSLEEFININSKHAKTIYRLLKQFKSTGQRIIAWDDFLDNFGLSNKNTINSMERGILQPAIAELNRPRVLGNREFSLFKNLRYTKIKDPKQRGRGGKIVAIRFEFEPQPLNEYQPLIDLPVPKEKNKTPQAPPDGKEPSQNDEWQLQKARELMAKIEEVSQQRKKKLYEGISELAHKCTAEQGKMGLGAPYARIKEEDENEDENEDEIHPITQERIGIFDEYLYLNVLIWDEKMQRNNTLKILDDLQLRALNFSTKIKNDEGAFKLNFINRDDDFITAFEFNNFSHFKAWFEAYKF